MMGDLNLKAASGGQIVLTPTNTASNYTLTLPAKTGNIITSADSGTVTGTMIASGTVAGSNLTTGGPTWNSNGAVALLNGVTNATGTGITFPATQSASSDVNTLDDYEEGAWTPKLKINGTETGITYSAQTGNYTKIGRVVTINFYIVLTSKGSSTGTAQVFNIPFTPTTGYTGLGVLAADNSMASFANVNWGLVWSDGNIYLRYNTATGYQDLTNSNFTDTSSFYVTVTYYV